MADLLPTPKQVSGGPTAKGDGSNRGSPSASSAASPSVLHNPSLSTTASHLSPQDVAWKSLLLTQTSTNDNTQPRSDSLGPSLAVSELRTRALATNNTLSAAVIAAAAAGAGTGAMATTSISALSSSPSERNYSLSPRTTRSSSPLNFLRQGANEHDVVHNSNTKGQSPRSFSSENQDTTHQVAGVLSSQSSPMPTIVTSSVGSPSQSSSPVNVSKSPTNQLRSDVAASSAVPQRSKKQNVEHAIKSRGTRLLHKNLQKTKSWTLGKHAIAYKSRMAFSWLGNESYKLHPGEMIEWEFPGLKLYSELLSTHLEGTLFITSFRIFFYPTPTCVLSRSQSVLSVDQTGSNNNANTSSFANMSANSATAAQTEDRYRQTLNANIASWIQRRLKGSKKRNASNPFEKFLQNGGINISGGEENDYDDDNDDDDDDDEDEDDDDEEDDDENDEDDEDEDNEADDAPLSSDEDLLKSNSSPISALAARDVDAAICEERWILKYLNLPLGLIGRIERNVNNEDPNQNKKRVALNAWNISLSMSKIAGASPNGRNSSSSADHIALEIYSKDGRHLRVFGFYNTQSADSVYEVMMRQAFGRTSLPSPESVFAYSYRPHHHPMLSISSPAVPSLASLSPSFTTTTTHAVNSSSIKQQTEGSIVDGWKVYDPRLEYARMGAVTNQANSPWKWIDVNIGYHLCSSYPQLLAVPSSISPDSVLRAAQYRSRGRFPALSWMHPSTGAAIVRCSQPRAGMQAQRSADDENLLKAVAASSRLANPPRLHVIDARPWANAEANRTRGWGYEKIDFYGDATIDFCSIGNIHVMRDSHKKLQALCAPPQEHVAAAASGPSEIDRHWLVGLESSEWLHNISLLLSASVKAAMSLDAGTSVVVHCSEGWDRTPAIVSIAQVMLDPYYRTLEGFAVLIEKEWIGFGHKFATRMGHADPKIHASPSASQAEIANLAAAMRYDVGFLESRRSRIVEELSPNFLQFLECIYQLRQQFLYAFEFSDHLLEFLAHEIFACRFGTFLANSLREREKLGLASSTASIWTHILLHRERFSDPNYAPEIPLQANANNLNTNGSFNINSSAPLGSVERGGSASGSSVHNRRSGSGRAHPVIHEDAVSSSFQSPEAHVSPSQSADNTSSSSSFEQQQQSSDQTLDLKEQSELSSQPDPSVPCFLLHRNSETALSPTHSLQSPTSRSISPKSPSATLDQQQQQQQQSNLPVSFPLPPPLIPDCNIRAMRLWRGWHLQWTAPPPFNPYDPKLWSDARKGRFIDDDDDDDEDSLEIDQDQSTDVNDTMKRGSSVAGGAYSSARSKALQEIKKLRARVAYLETKLREAGLGLGDQ